ncbi:FecR family protein [Henriciella aquimarina]|uniref:FecR family protein n=1 Tax=Henriciella aquimarina TaxID=545261 RepID=UPI000A0742B6|nr:FecR family protein [Henriciella aquimarina]
MAAGDDTHSARLKAAAAWYGELQEPDLSAERWDAFQAWESDPANAAAFAEIERTLVVTDRTAFGRAAKAGGHKRRDGRVPAWAGWLGGVAAALLVGLVVIGLWPQGRAAEPEVYQTAVGEIREVALADGSSVTLNTASRVEVTLGKETRGILLSSGEALFDVAKEDRPFVVRAGPSRTEALGTRFNIRTGDDAVAVTLVDGSVEVRGTGRPGRRLSPGEQLIMDRAGAVSVTGVDPAQVTGWQAGMIVFDATTLAEAVAEMNRYSDVTLVIADEGLAGERVSGAFPAGEPDAFSENLELFLPLEVERSGGEIVLRRAGE